LILQTISIIAAAAIISLAWSKIGKKNPRKDFQYAILWTLLAILVLILSSGLTDPPNGWSITIDLSTIVTWITLILSGVTLLKALIWAISKTDLYTRIILALNALVETRKSVKTIKEMYKKVHKKEL
jgi:asparagine N-glycosylation enzyme membrane subunit Stt3